MLKDVDALHRGRRLILMARIHGAPEARSLESGQEQQQDSDDADHVLECKRIIANAAKTLRTPDVIPTQSDYRDDLGEAKGQQQEIDAFDAQGGKADHDPD